MNLKKIIKEEINSFDWVKSILEMEPIQFEEAEVGKTYRIESTEVLLETIGNCNNTQQEIYHSKMATVLDKREWSYSNINCVSRDRGKVLALSLEFHLTNRKTYPFWVSDDMVRLYES